MVHAGLAKRPEAPREFKRRLGDVSSVWVGFKGGGDVFLGVDVLDGDLCNVRFFCFLNVFFVLFVSVFGVSFDNIPYSSNLDTSK